MNKITHGYLKINSILHKSMDLHYIFFLYSKGLFIIYEPELAVNLGSYINLGYKKLHSQSDRTRVACNLKPVQPNPG